MPKKITPDDAPLVHSPFASLAGRSAPDEPRASVDEKTPPSSSTKETLLARTAKLVVRMERKGHGGKTVTRVTGVDDSAREACARELKRALGTGVRVDDEGALLVQGDHVERVARLLEEMGATRVVRGT